MSEAEAENEETKELDLGNPDVVTKYKLAAEIANSKCSQENMGRRANHFPEVMLFSTFVTSGIDIFSAILPLPQRPLLLSLLKSKLAPKFWRFARKETL